MKRCAENAKKFGFEVRWVVAVVLLLVLRFRCIGVRACDICIGVRACDMSHAYSDTAVAGFLCCPCGACRVYGGRAF